MTTTITAPTNKQIILDLLDRLPETATLSEISEQVATLAALDRSQKDIDEGRVLSQEEARQRTAWTGK